MGIYTYLMSEDQYVFLPLKFHNNRLEAYDNISVGLAASVTIVEFVFVTVGKIFGVCLLRRNLYQRSQVRSVNNNTSISS